MNQSLSQPSAILLAELHLFVVFVEMRNMAKLFLQWIN